MGTDRLHSKPDGGTYHAGDKIMTENFKEQIQKDIDFAKQKEAEFKKMSSDWRKDWKKKERMLAKMEAKK